MNTYVHYRKALFLAGTTLPRWMKVKKICMNPKVPEPLSLENASHLVIDLGDPETKDDSFSLTRVTKMKNLECLELRNLGTFYDGEDLYQHLYYLDLPSDVAKCQEIFKALQPNKIRSVIVDDVSESFIQLVQEYFPQVSTALVYGQVPSQRGFGSKPFQDLGFLFSGLKNLQKIVIKGVSFLGEFDDYDIIDSSWSKNQVKELHLIGKLEFFREDFIMNYKSLFPKLEKLIIDPWDMDRNFDQG